MIKEDFDDKNKEECRDIAISMLECYGECFSKISQFTIFTFFILLSIIFA
jgi:hypothetical protein